MLSEERLSRSPRLDLLPPKNRRFSALPKEEDDLVLALLDPADMVDAAEEAVLRRVGVIGTGRDVLLVMLSVRGWSAVISVVVAVGVFPPDEARIDSFAVVELSVGVDDIQACRCKRVAFRGVV